MYQPQLNEYVNYVHQKKDNIHGVVVGINVLETPVVLDIPDVVTSVVTPVDGLAVGVPDVVLPGLEVPVVSATVVVVGM